MSNVVFKVPGWLREMLSDRFRRYLIIILVVLGVGLSLAEYRNQLQVGPQEKQISFFYHPQCPHCREQKKFIPYLQAKYPELPWVSYDTSNPENSRLLAKKMVESGLSEKDAAVPMTFIGPYVVRGFRSPETTGVRLEKAILAYLKDDPSLYPEEERGGQSRETVRLPLIREIKPADYSLPALAVIIGLVDGFNPCAMWVLVYLISLILSMNDRRKVWFLVMLDDLIIFSLAVLALDTGIGTRYAGYCKIIGGLVLVVLGGIMVFGPELLR